MTDRVQIIVADDPGCRAKARRFPAVGIVILTVSESDASTRWRRRKRARPQRPQARIRPARDRHLELQDRPSSTP